MHGSPTHLERFQASGCICVGDVTALGHQREVKLHILKNITSHFTLHTKMYREYNMLCKKLKACAGNKTSVQL